ncbi:MAG: nickel pincer cofactor biosynthesis protein LarB [Alphaproteobacteria bacterium]|nr:nickel pincer cofactor biosynthesis protein LarB [Alphaproteobacteria bacterium]
MTDDQIKLDWERRRRLGFDEAVFCSGKSTAQLTAILDQVAAAEERMLLTRLDQAAFSALPDIHRSALDHDPVSRTAFFGAPIQVNARRAAVVTAGTSDVPVAAEAVRTLEFNGIGSLAIHDVGVAGLWRLVERIDEIKALPVVIVVAGMDGALPSVVGGLAPGLVIAVPTSVGYGAARHGETALNAALASCAPGLVVCNIDNGYGAACAAIRALGR